MNQKLKDHILGNLKISVDEALKNLENPESDDLKEKINIFKNYYSFIYNKDCIDFIDNVWEVLKKELKYQIKTKDDYVYTLSIIILKAFINYSNIYSNKKTVSKQDICGYCVDQFEKYLFLQNIFMLKNSADKIILHAIDKLIEKKVITQRTIYEKVPNFFRTLILYSIDINAKIPKSYNYAFKPFNWLEILDSYYIHTDHYSTFYRVNKENFYSGKSFQIKNKSYIIGKINIKLYVDKKYQQILKKELHTEGHAGALKDLYSELENAYSSCEWGVGTREKISIIQRKISKLEAELETFNFANTDFKENYLIFPLYMDFRGRKYHYSPLSPTTSKLTRFAFYYGHYDVIEEKNKYSVEYKEKINKFCLENNINADVRFTEAIFWCLIGIGKFFIEKDKYPISTEIFLDKAITNFNSENKLSTEKKMEMLNTKNILYSLHDSKIKKRVLSKDATASINQIFMKKLGPINQKALEYVNLGNKNEWYDTYAVHVDKFFETYPEIDPKDHKYFIRKLIKDVVMTVPYSAGRSSRWEEFVRMCDEQEIQINYDKSPNKNTKKVFEKFYKFVKFEMQTLFLYRRSIQSVVDKMSEKFEKEKMYAMKSDTGIADISYFKMKKSSIDKKYKSEGKSKRITSLVMKPSEALDLKSFNRACGANSAHFLDADEIREVETILKYSMTTVHDCYLIDFINCTQLIEAKLQHYNQAMKKFNINPATNIFISQ